MARSVDRRKAAYVPPAGRSLPLTIFYERCEDAEGPYRWWRSDMPGDVFDIIGGEALRRRIEACAVLEIRVVDHLPGFCSEGEKCPEHLGIR